MILLPVLLELAFKCSSTSGAACNLQDQPPPARSKDPSALQQATSKLLPLDVMALEEKEQLSELDVMAVVQNDSTYTQQVSIVVCFVVLVEQSVDMLVSWQSP